MSTTKILQKFLSHVHDFSFISSAYSFIHESHYHGGCCEIQQIELIPMSDHTILSFQEQHIEYLYCAKLL